MTTELDRDKLGPNEELVPEDDRVIGRAFRISLGVLIVLASLVAIGQYDAVLGSRIVSRGELEGGMHVYKYSANRFLTWTQNIVLGQKLSEYHTGYRAFSREVLETLPLAENSDDFVFDNQMLAQIIWNGYVVAEVSCPTKYFSEASSINFRRSILYGLGCVLTAVQLFLVRKGILDHKRFPREP